MSTTTVPLSITCPEWCEITAELHAADLWNMGGECIHHSSTVEVFDTAGYERPLHDTTYHSPVSIFLSAATSPDGGETESAIVFLNERELSVTQALAVADILRHLVQQYRAAGGLS